MPIASLTTGEIETKAMGAEFGAGHFLSAPYFQALENPTNEKFVEGFMSSPYGKNGATNYNMAETYNSAYVFKAAMEKAIADHGVEEVTSASVREACAGVKLSADISPEGETWVDGDNFNTWLVPKIGRCKADGSFEIVKQADEHVAPDPFSIYADAGKCMSNGLVAPDGSVRVDVI